MAGAGVRRRSRGRAPNGGLPNPFSGIKGAMRLYGKLRDVRLVWVDPPDGRELT
ncbi:hypothetical protein O7632_13690 [Solwaraspora sp. WMMD406]|uniref:hypothetical protein n=1 Tax=Solwaraspora sp. WMMD406 TaxID=3016095 RepID=UPI002416D815|nr:hypothetical protein [Solwaraspora sp. WMMD406]MDG4765141.1 hypothetical protein [Solwaraspora sp. WMMD406]